LQNCAKRNKPQLNAIIVNDLDVEISKEALNQLAVEDALAEEMGQLSLNEWQGLKWGTQ
jgi:hypothetical protein